MKVIKDPIITMTRKCELKVKLCLDIEAYSTLNLKYTIFHFNKITAEDDTCNSKAINYEWFGLFKTCPAKEVNLIPSTLVK